MTTPRDPQMRLSADVAPYIAAVRAAGQATSKMANDAVADLARVKGAWEAAERAAKDYETAARRAGAVRAPGAPPAGGGGGSAGSSTAAANASAAQSRAATAAANAAAAQSRAATAATNAATAQQRLAVAGSGASAAQSRAAAASASAAAAQSRAAAAATSVATAQQRLAAATAAAAAAQTRAAMAASAQAAQQTQAVAAATAAAAAATEAAATREEAANRRRTEAVDDVARAARASTLVLVAGFLLSAREAIRWESAWAGVTKTVEGTTGEMAALEKELRGMAKTLPTTHKEIAAVAEAAGQLGVKRHDIAEFTKQMIMLGVSTNLSADEAATSIAQMMNIMKTSPGDVGRLSAALVALGNAGASTEKDILEMSKRFAGAAAIAGLAESDVLGLANAMASVGIKSELGGGAMTRIILKMVDAVATGGDKLEAFARAAGMSAQDFAALWEKRPVEAIMAVTNGLGAMNERGENVVAALADMGLKGTQNTQVMLGLAGSSNLVNESVALGSKAWSEQSALLVEATKRFETTESKLKVARNQIVDTAISFGNELLPAVQAAAAGVGNFAEAIGNIPQPVKSLIVDLGGTAATLGLVAAAMVLAARRGQALLVNMTMLALSGATLRNKWVALAAVTAVIYGIGKAGEAMGDAALNAAQLESAIVDLGTSASSAQLERFVRDFDALKNGSGIDKMTADFIGATGAIGRFADGFANFFGASNPVVDATKSISALDKSLADMARNGHAEAAAEAYRKLGEAAEAQGMSMEEFARKFPNYGAALIELENKAKLAGSGTDELAESTGMLGGTMVMTSEEVDKLISSIDDLIAGEFEGERATIDFRDKLQGLRDQITAAREANEDGAASFDLNTAAGRRNASAVMDLVESKAREIEVMIEAGESQDRVREATEAAKNEIADAAEQMGLSRDQAYTYASALDNIPSEVGTVIEADPEPAKAAVVDVRKRLEDLLLAPSRLRLDADTEPAKAGFVDVRKGLEDLLLAPSRLRVTADTHDADTNVSYVKDRLRELLLAPSRLRVDADTEPAKTGFVDVKERLRDLLLNPSHVRVTADADLGDAYSARNDMQNWMNQYPGSVRLDGQADLGGLYGARNDVQQWMWSYPAGLDMHGNPQLGGLYNARNALQDWLNQNPVTVIQQGREMSPGGGYSQAGGYQKYADGGLVRGVGGPRDDANLAWLSRGEYVINARDAARTRPLLDAINAGRRVKVPGMAAGGMAGYRRRLAAVNDNLYGHRGLHRFISPQAPVGGGFDMQAMGAAVAVAVRRELAGLVVRGDAYLDGQKVGTVLGRTANMRARTR